MQVQSLSERENYLRALEFRYPAWIPITFDLLPALWMRYGDALGRLVARHPRIFPERETSRDWHNQPFTTPDEYLLDDWGCLWHNAQPGMLGQVVGHPLADWRALDTFRPPDPRQQFDWRALRERVAAERRAGHLTRGTYAMTQGGFFDRLQFLRGLENLLLDFAAEPPQLQRLIDMVLEYNLAYLRLWLELGVDQIVSHGDIATQRGLMMSPATFRKYLKPAYREMFSLCRRAGVHVWYSCDGRVLEIVDDLIECGVTLHDPQVRANTLAGITAAYKGKLCALVDIDEQMLPFCTPEEVRAQVQEVVRLLGDPRGGLMIYACPSPDVPLENIAALCSAWEEFCTLPARAT